MFSVTVDYLLGVDKTEKDKRLEEIYNEIKNINFYVNSNEETLQNARKFAAEFPSNENILCHLANEICRLHQWNEKTNLAILNEAEKIYIALIENTKNVDMKNDVIARLASLYANGYKNYSKCDDALDMLSKLSSCRELTGAGVYASTPLGVIKKQTVITILNNFEKFDYIRQGSYPSKAKKVHLTEEGILKAQKLLEKYNIK